MSTDNFMIRSVHYVEHVAALQERNYRKVKMMLHRLKHFLNQRRIGVELDSNSLAFYCPTEEITMELAAAIPVPLTLEFYRSLPLKKGTVRVYEGADDGNLDDNGSFRYEFQTTVVRPIKMSECTVVRFKVRHSSFKGARLFWHDMEVATIERLYETVRAPKLRQRLWLILEEKKAADPTKVFKDYYLVRDAWV
jgi:hypothetical protein